jgi:hypothetical protein
MSQPKAAVEPVVRRFASAIAVTVVVLLCTGDALGQGSVSTALQPVRARPTDSSRLLAKALNVDQGVELTMSGFADDIGIHDRIALRSKTSSRSVRTSFSLSPPLVRGEERVYSRTLGWLREFKSEGARVRRVIVDFPSSAAGDSLSKASIANLGLLLALPQVNKFCSSAGITALAVGAPSVSGETGVLWRAACRNEVSSRAKAAVLRAVRATFPGCVVTWRNDHQEAATEAVFPSTSAAKSAGQQSSVALSGGVVSGTNALSKVNVATGKGQATPEQLALITSAIKTDAKRALLGTTPTRRLKPWNGGLSQRHGDWQRIFDAARASPELRRYLLGLDGGAQRTLRVDPRMYRRPSKLADIPPELLDPQYHTAGSNGELFALAMADCGQSNFVRSQGVELAVMAAFSGNSEYLAKAIEILEAMRGHEPLQRPGWTAYKPEARVPAEGDGVWLATAWGIEGIVEMLSILGDKVPLDLRAQLDSLIRREVARIVADWANATPWYVKNRSVQSNQWIETTVGLIRGCLYLGDPEVSQAYDLGAENLAASLATLGDDGAFSEGISYASMTVGTLFDALAAMKANGDLRCHEFPFVNKSWRWFIQMQMPGARYVNCFDSRMGSAPAWAIRTPLPSLISAAIGSSDPAAIAQTRQFFPSGDTSVPAVRYQYALDASRALAQGTAIEIPTFAEFPSQALIVWRSKWEPAAATQSALGLWVRGGSLRDSHCHRDQGQVSIYCGNRMILMDSGTPSYSHPDFEGKFASAAGHGIMQVGEVRPRSKPVDVPVNVESLDAMGGCVYLDAAPAYESVKSCRRRIEWKATGNVTITDGVSFLQPVPADTELYRFHSGCSDRLTIVGAGRSWNVSWPGTSMDIVADAEIHVSQVVWPDAVMPSGQHQVIVISSPKELNGLQLRSSLAIELDAR